MEKKIDDFDSSAWVDQKIAALRDVSEWSPNSIEAYQRFTKIRELRQKTPGVQSLGRLAMAFTIAALIVAVVVILPWKNLRTLLKEIKPEAAQQTIH